jgi:hypothetical protein
MTRSCTPQGVKSLSRFADPWPVFVLLLAAWLISRSYPGIKHDGIIYAAQTLSHAYPDIFARDLFNVAGTQSRYSIFPSITAVIVQFIPLSLAALGWTLTGLIFFYTATYRLCQIVFAKCIDVDDGTTGSRTHELLTAITVSLLVVLPGVYGGSVDGKWLLTIAEPYYTPRVWAEALCVMALAMAIEGRKVLCVSGVSLALALHPLVALTAGVVLLGAALPRLISDRCLTNRRRLVLNLLPVAGLTVALLLATLLQRYDELWWTVVQDAASRIVFPTQWKLETWQVMTWCSAVHLCFWIVVPLNQKSRQFLGLIWAVVFALHMIGIALGDGMKGTMVTSLQLWRSQWVLLLVAIIGSGASLYYAFVKSHWQELSGAVLLVASNAFLGTQHFYWVIMIACLLLVHVRKPANPAWNTIGLLAIAMVCALTAVGSVSYYKMGELMTKHPLCLALICVALLSLFVKASKIKAILAVGVFAVVVTKWDSRTPSTKSVENDIGRMIGLSLAAGRGGVYWIGGPLEGPWIYFGRASYIDPLHATNLPFSRVLLVEYLKRLEVIRPLIKPMLKIEASDIRRVCSSINGPDYIAIDANLKTAREFSTQLSIQTGTGEVRLVECRMTRGAHP